MKFKRYIKKTLFITMLALSNIAESSSYIPKDDFILLEVPETNLVAVYRNKINNNPNDVQLLASLINELIEQAKKQNSDLLFGQIESMLAKNRRILETNDKLRILYADVLQHRHAFDKAKKYLEKIDESNAILIRATIYQNLGEYSNASRECKNLVGRINIFVASTCLIHARSYQGNLNHSYNALKKISRNIQDPLNKLWSITALAEMAYRNGNSDESLDYYQQANKISPDNKHILSEWVDVLYSENKQSEILALLEDNHSDMRLNIRYLRSIFETSKYVEADHKKDFQDLSNAITLTELRKDQRHYDTRAEYYLWIKRDSDKALSWANKNWNVSKTPAAARLLFMTSKMSGDISLLKEIKKWMVSSNIEDSHLEKLFSSMVSFETVI